MDVNPVMGLLRGPGRPVGIIGFFMEEIRDGAILGKNRQYAARQWPRTRALMPDVNQTAAGTGWTPGIFWNILSLNLFFLSGARLGLR